MQRKRRQRRRAQFSPPRGGAVDQRYARALPREPFPARAPCHSAETLWQGATWQPPAARAAARSTFAAIPFMFLSYPCCNRLQVNPRPPLVAAAGTAVAAAAAAPATAGAAIATIIADTIAAAAAVSAAIAAATAITAAIAAATAITAAIAAASAVS